MGEDPEEMAAWLEEFELRQARWAFGLTSSAPLQAMWRDDWRESDRRG